MIGGNDVVGIPCASCVVYICNQTNSLCHLLLLFIWKLPSSIIIFFLNFTFLLLIKISSLTREKNKKNNKQ